jgi:AsmA protein
MRNRLKWVALLAVAAVLSGGGFYRWPLSSAFVARQIDARHWPAGVVMRGPGRVSLSILPMPALHIVDAEWDGPNGVPVLTAPRADVRIALAALAAGRFEPVGAMLQQPTAFIDLDAESPGSARSGATGWPGEIAMRQGFVHIFSATRKIDALITDVEGILDYSGPATSLRASLRATWRDEPLTIDVQLAPAVAGADGDASAASLALAANNARIKFDGDIVSNLTLKGRLSAAIPAATPLRRLFDLSDDTFTPLQDIALEGAILASAKAIQMTQLNLSVGEQKFEGALTLEEESRGAALSGTLAADELNLDKFLAAAPPVFDASGGWSEAKFQLPRISPLALDLRLSAARLLWRGHELDDAALAVLGRDGELAATLLDASAYNGRLKGEIALSRHGDGLGLRATGNLAAIDIAALLGDFGLSAASGQGGGEFTLRSAGVSPAALVRGLNGNAEVELTGGAIDGVSFEEALRRSLRRSIDPGSDMRMGQTAFTEAAARLKIADGRAEILSALLKGPGINVTVEGAFDLAMRRIDAKATAVQADGAGIPTPDGPRLVFGVAGPWMAPAVSPGSGG